jgi:hypothetical protein
MSLELVFAMLLVVTCVVGIGGVVHAFLTKMHELEGRARGDQVEKAGGGHASKPA